MLKPNLVSVVHNPEFRQVMKELLKEAMQEVMNEPIKMYDDSHLQKLSPPENCFFKYSNYAASS